MDGTQNQQQGFSSRLTIIPMYQTVANIYESIYNGAKEIGDINQNMLPRQKEMLAATKRTCILLVLQMSVWSDEHKIFTAAEIKELYKKDLEMLMIDAAIWTQKAHMQGYLETSATSFFEQMQGYKAYQKEKGEK